MIAETGWPDVAIAAIGAIPGILAVYIGYRIHTQIRTPSGKPIGEVAEFTHDTAIANNLMLLTTEKRRHDDQPGNRTPP